MRKNSKTIGDIAELKAATYFAENDCYVMTPFGDNAPYDLVIDDHTSLLKVQVKSRNEKNGVVELHLYTQDKRGKKTLFTEKDFDLLFIYLPNQKRACLLNWDDLNKIKENASENMRLRLIPTKNNQKKGVNFFKDYEIVL